MTTAIVCPGCGSPNHYQSSSNPKKRTCENCGKVYYTDQPETVKDRQEEEVHPPVSPTTEEQPTKDTSGNGWYGIIMMLVVLAVLGGFVFLIYQDVRQAPEISTIGQYEVWPADCENDTVVVEYGFEGEGPLLTVYPERKGEDIWIISPQIEKEISTRAATELDYLWIHCDNAEKEPEYFLYYFPLPVDGMKVVFKD